MVMSIYTLTDAIIIGQGVGANALAALASGLMGCNAGGGSDSAEYYGKGRRWQINMALCR